MIASKKSTKDAEANAGANEHGNANANLQLELEDLRATVKNMEAEVGAAREMKERLRKQECTIGKLKGGARASHQEDRPSVSKNTARKALGDCTGAKQNARHNPTPQSDTRDGKMRQSETPAGKTRQAKSKPQDTPCDDYSTSDLSEEDGPEQRSPNLEALEAESITVHPSLLERPSPEEDSTTTGPEGGSDEHWLQRHLEALKSSDDNKHRSEGMGQTPNDVANAIQLLNIKGSKHRI